MINTVRDHPSRDRDLLNVRRASAIQGGTSNVRPVQHCSITEQKSDSRITRHDRSIQQNSSLEVHWGVWDRKVPDLDCCRTGKVISAVDVVVQLWFSAGAILCPSWILRDMYPDPTCGPRCFIRSVNPTQLHTEQNAIWNALFYHFMHYDIYHTSIFILSDIGY